MTGHEQRATDRGHQTDAGDDLRLRGVLLPDAHLIERHGIRARRLRLLGAADHVFIDERERPEGATGDKHGLLVEKLPRHRREAALIEQHRIREAEADQPDQGRTVIEVAEAGPAEMGEIDLHAARPDVLDDGLHEFIDGGAAVQGRMDQVHAHHAERVLLTTGIAIPQPQVEDDIAWFRPWFRLEAHAHPGVSLPFAVMRRRGHGIREGKETRLGAALGSQPIDQESILVTHHLLEAFARDVALRVTIDSVADPHIIRRHALGDRPGGAAGLEEMPNDLLPGADLREDPVGGPIEVDGQRLAGGHRTGLFMSSF